jgi:two-component system, NarL family, sensor histidine kinase BarA
MSYQSIKRVLGETSLERKCRFLFGVCLFFLISGSFWWYSFATEQLVYKNDRITGRLSVYQSLLSKHLEWATTVDPTKPLQGEDPNAVQFKDMVQNMVKNLPKQEYQAYFITNSNQDDNEQQRDETEWERSLLDRFSKPSPADHAGAENAVEFEEQRLNSGTYIYYQPIRAKEYCLRLCHSVPPMEGAGAFSTGIHAIGKITARAPGDLLAVCRVTISNRDTETAIIWNKATLLATAIITVFLAMLASYAIVRYVIVKPLRHLRDVSDSISRGDISLRADIHTGDEFEELAVAFNRMLRHLTTIQEELRQVNASLDGKVDELAQVNMRLYEMNMLKSDFLSTMSHELRTPLNSILGFSDVLAAIDALDEKQKRYVQNIQKSGRTLLDMINDILDLAKIESGKMETRLTEFRIDLVVGTQCDLARPLSEKKNIDLESHLPSDPPPMRQDQARVQQILNNLLSNAIKFTPEGGRITVSVERDQRDFMVLKVSDTGVGIAEEDQQSIFEKFRQGRTAMPGGDAMTREHSGTGLGLSIVKELCKLLGGEVSVQSELGKGSTFTIRLPWRLEEQPRLDSSLIEGFSDFGKPRIEFLPGNSKLADANDLDSRR